MDVVERGPLYKTFEVCTCGYGEALRIKSDLVSLKYVFHDGGGVQELDKRSLYIFPKAVLSKVQLPTWYSIPMPKSMVFYIVIKTFRHKTGHILVVLVTFDRYDIERRLRVFFVS